MNNYAVNIGDLTAIEPLFIAEMVVGPVTIGKLIVHTSKKTIDSGAVVLECDDERAEAIIGTLNLKAFVRAYKKGTRGAWRRMTKTEIKTIG